MNKKIITSMIMLVVGIGMFFAGMKFEAKKTASILQSKIEQVADNQNKNQDQKQVQDQSKEKPTSIIGEVISRDEQGLTIKMKDGIEKEIFVSQDTKVRKTEFVDFSVISIGQQVSVNFKNGENGRVNADGISIFATLK